MGAHRSCSQQSVIVPVGGGWRSMLRPPDPTAITLAGSVWTAGCRPSPWLRLPMVARSPDSIGRLALATAMRQQRRMAKSLSRKKKGSNNRRDARARLARHHNHVRNVRQHFLHSVSNELVKTHDRFVLED